MKKEIAIDFIHKSVGVIYMYTTNDALADLQGFGDVQQSGAPYPPQHFRLRVDARFDFDEVVAYIENYGA